MPFSCTFSFPLKFRYLSRMSEKGIQGAAPSLPVDGLGASLSERKDSEKKERKPEVVFSQPPPPGEDAYVGSSFQSENHLYNGWGYLKSSFAPLPLDFQEMLFSRQ